MEYRRLTREDLEEYFQFRLEALEQSPRTFISTAEEVRARGSGEYGTVLESESDDNVIYGAFSEGEMIGCVGIVRTDRMKTRHRSSIWGMYVRAGLQGKGIGSKLLDLAIEHAREKMKAATVYLTVESSNSAAVRLYETRSFKTWGREPKAVFFENEFSDVIHMNLDLEEEGSSFEK